MKPKRLRRRALQLLEKAEEKCHQPEAKDLLLTAEQLLLNAEELDDIRGAQNDLSS